MKLQWNTSVLGLSIEPDELRICRTRSQGAKLEAAELPRAPISAEQFKSSPIEAGRLLKNHLKTAGIKSRKCVVCIPLAWAFTSQVDLPSLSGEDLQSFLALEAEKQFPFSPGELALSVAPAQGGAPEGRALLLGVPSDYVANVLAAMKAAHLRCAGITFAMSALAETHPDANYVLLNMTPGIVDLAVLNGGGLLALRNLAWLGRQSGASEDFDVREIARQIRITLAHTTPEKREAIKNAVVYGDDSLQRVWKSLGESMKGLGITLDRGALHGLPGQTPGADPALAVAARVLAGGSFAVDLMPKRKPLSRAARLSHQSIRRMIVIATAAMILLVGAYIHQTWRLAALEGQWAAIDSKVAEVKGLQERVRQFRAWYDSAIPSLAIPACLANAFPEDGGVWIKSLNVKDGSIVTCTGSARSRNDWLQVMDKLGKSGELSDLQVVQTRGDSPFGFTLTFHWKRRDAGGS